MAQRFSRPAHEGQTRPLLPLLHKLVEERAGRGGSQPTRRPSRASRDGFSSAHFSDCQAARKTDLSSGAPRADEEALAKAEPPSCGAKEGRPWLPLATLWPTPSPPGQGLRQKRDLGTYHRNAHLDTAQNLTIAQTAPPHVYGNGGPKGRLLPCTELSKSKSSQ